MRVVVILLTASLVSGSTTDALTTITCGPKLHIHQFQAGPMKNFQYLLESEGSALVIDAAWDIRGLEAFALARGLVMVGGLYTHAHFDHVGGNGSGQVVEGAAQLQVAASSTPSVWVGGAELEAAASQSGLPASAWRPLDDGDAVHVLGEAVQLSALATSGHTSGGVSYLVRVSGASGACADGVALTGDTLFAGGVGRTDLPGGSQGDMLHSLARLGQLPPGTIVLPGHGYGPARSTIGAELNSNSWMQKARLAFASMPPPLPRTAMQAPRRDEF